MEGCRGRVAQLVLGTGWKEAIGGVDVAALMNDRLDCRVDGLRRCRSAVVKVSCCGENSVLRLPKTLQG